MFSRSFNIRNLLVIPLAIVALMLGAQCAKEKDDFNNEALLSLFSEGGIMTVSVDGGAANTWNRCRATYMVDHWEVLGSNLVGSVKLLIGTGKVADSPFNGSTLASKEYIVYGDGTFGYCGVIDPNYNTGTSTITVATNDANTIAGTYTGTVCRNNSNPLTCHTVAGLFTALK
jgi:hypothetical protein